MAEYLIRRIFQSIITLFLVTVLAFTLMHLAPGGPTQVMIAPGMSPEAFEVQKRNLGLDDPIVTQYFRWIGDLIQGDLGHTFKNNVPVGDILWPTVGNTLVLMAAAWIVTLLIAIPWGIYNSTRIYGISDQTASFVSYLGFAMPTFWFGIILQQIFAMELRWLPLSDMWTYGKEGQLGDLAWHLVMPVTVLSLGFLAAYVKYTRASMLEVLDQDYIRTARAKGVRERKVVHRHALRNALIPVVTIIGMDMPLLVSGAALTEKVFNWPGMGRLFVDMANAREYSVLMAIVIITAIFVILGNLLADLLYAVVDPRVQLGRKGGGAR